MRLEELRRALTRPLLAAAAGLAVATLVYGQGMGGGMMGGGGGGFGMGGGMMGGGGGFNGRYGMGSNSSGGDGAGYGPGYGGGSRELGSYSEENAASVYDRLNLSKAQRAKIDAIEQRSARERSALNDDLRSQQDRLQAFYASGNTDDATTRRIYRSLSATRTELFEESLATRRQIDAVLTREQRAELAHERASRPFALDSPALESRAP